MSDSGGDRSGKGRDLSLIMVVIEVAKGGLHQ